jgi:hypothetical protein
MPNKSAIEALVGSMTIEELSAKSNRSVSSIVDWALGAGGGRKASTPSAAAQAASGANGRSKAVNTRSAAGRSRYEAAVFDVVRDADSSIKAPEIRARVGGTPQQARAALNRLIEEGRVSFEGKARATAYSAA